MMRRHLSHHLIVIVMLSLAGIGWLAQDRFGPSWVEGAPGVAARPLDALLPGALLIVLAALFDGYRSRQKTLLASERARSELAMALRAAREVNEPLTLIITNLEMTVSRMHPASDGFAVLDPARSAAWHVLDRIRRLTELTDLPREAVILPSLLQAVEGRSIPSVDEPPPAHALRAAIGSRPRSAW
jgi:hypothetical protein